MPRKLQTLLTLACLGAALTSSTVHAQSVVRVLDSDGAPIPYALVQASGGAERVVDSLGRVRFSNDLGASPSLLVRRLGYAPFQGKVSAEANGEFVVRLEPAARALSEVRVVADRSNTPLARTGFYDRMQRVQRGAIVGTFITPEELERRSPTLTSHVLTGLPSVRIQRASDGRPIVLGRGGCPMTVLLDGQRLNGLLQESASARNTSLSPNGQFSGGGRDSDRPSIDQISTPNELMAIEVYNSTANAPSELIPLTGGGSCGIIALWTGPRR